MRSTFSGFNTAVRGLYGQQISLDTVGHNITNAGVEGYSRQSVNLSATPSQTVYSGYGASQIGTGVQIDSIVRARDHFVDRQFWKENSTFSYGQAVQDGLKKVEDIFREPTETGIQSTMNKFWNSWQSLSVNAADYGSRAVVKASGAELVDALQLAAKQLKAGIDDNNALIKIKVEKVNQINSELYALNQQIVGLEMGGDHANDLRDRRDSLVGQLSSLAGISISEDAKGNYNISISGHEVVNGSGYIELKTNSVKDKDYGFEYVNVFAGSTDEKALINFSDGELKAITDLRAGDMIGAKKYLDELVTMSKFLLRDFNEAHRAGMGTDNSKNNNFFGNERNADGSDYDYKNDPDGRTKSWTKNDWIKALGINEVLNTTEGLGKIAAKTSLTSEISTGVLKPTEITTAGKRTVGSTDTVTITKKADGKYYANVVGRNPAVEVEAHYSKGALSFTVDGLTVTSMVNEAAITSTQYKISGAVDSAGVITPLDSMGHEFTGESKLSLSATGTYTGGTTATKVKVEQAADGKYYYTVGDDGTPIEFDPLTDTPVIMGMTVKFKSPLPTAAGIYTFSLTNNNNASGDNAVNLGNRLKNDTSEILGNTSFETYYASLIADLGVRAENSIRLTENQDAMLNSIVNLRESICGVGLDQELSYMIQFSKGYSAASRVLTTMDEMLDKLMNTGVVGR